VTQRMTRAWTTGMAAAVLAVLPWASSRASPWDEVLVFGDSLSDVGNVRQRSSEFLFGLFTTPDDRYFALAIEHRFVCANQLPQLAASWRQQGGRVPPREFAVRSGAISAELALENWLKQTQQRSGGRQGWADLRCSTNAYSVTETERSRSACSHTGSSSNSNVVRYGTVERKFTRPKKTPVSASRGIYVSPRSSSSIMPRSSNSWNRYGTFRATILRFGFSMYAIRL